jgi:ribosome-associated protein|tara:strand:+ start:341 stop:709 length:369 start_codon:yes stop_codon:yes gene_type:complete
MKESDTDFIFDQPLLSQILDLAIDKKAGRIVIFDVRGLSSLTDFFMVCHGNSEAQVKAIVDNIRKGTENKPRHLEGYENQNWILLDYFDVVVHVFKKDERDYYELERLWADAPIKEINDEGS